MSESASAAGTNGVDDASGQGSQLTDQDKLNQRVWATGTAARDLDFNESYTDAGERAALESISAEVRGKPILDLGVGRGRTIALLSPLTDDYRAVDYMQQMVDVSRARYPGVNVQLGDARLLSGLPAEHFGFVQFSYNGIDAVSAEDRHLIFAAVQRVLAPGGIFLFSTLNMDGPAFRERPWRISLPKVKNPLRFAVRLTRYLAWAPVHIVNWSRLKRRAAFGAGYAVAPLSAHHWGVLAHYTTLSRQLEELERAGFARDPVVLDNLEGKRVSSGASTRNIDWFHILTRKAG